MSKTLGKILLVSASEIEAFKSLDQRFSNVVTGVGIAATTFCLTKELIANQYDLVINMGIAGSFNPAFKIGDVVQVRSDMFSELGVEDNGKFVPAHEINLVSTGNMIFRTKSELGGLPKVNGITVNKVHGSASTIEAVFSQFNPDIETMEGAAVAYVCQQFGVPWVQIRAISNRVEPRNRDAWNIPLAIENLHAQVERSLNSM
ncbi:futalosine hydrolase [Flavobacteriales bacterium]|nr:futalosine hydrolase [Flavobacteriales bacterium]